MTKGHTLAWLVAFDLGTKALAGALLSPGSRFREAALFQFWLTTNKQGAGTWALKLAANAPPIQIAIAGVSTGALGIYLLAAPRLSRRGWSLLRQVLVGVAVYVASRFVGALAITVLGGVSPTVATAVTRAGGTLVFIALWRTAESQLWRWSMTLFTAAALGNLLCLLPPPHQVVDFMYSALVTKILHQGIFNVADLYFDAALACLALAIAQSVTVRLKSHVRDRNN